MGFIKAKKLPNMFVPWESQTYRQVFYPACRYYLHPCICIILKWCKESWIFFVGRFQFSLPFSTHVLILCKQMSWAKVQKHCFPEFSFSCNIDAEIVFTFTHVYVVAQFYPWFPFCFILLIIHHHTHTTTTTKIQIKPRIKLNCNLCTHCRLLFSLWKIGVQPFCDITWEIKFKTLLSFFVILCIIHVTPGVWARDCFDTVICNISKMQNAKKTFNIFSKSDFLPSLADSHSHFAAKALHSNSHCSSVSDPLTSRQIQWQPDL